MDEQALREGIRRVTERVGPWGSDNIHLGAGVFTMGPHVQGIELRAARVLQVAEDLLGPDWAGRRVLDLGAAEGLFAVELARRGASVVAIEARAPHVERLSFARDALGLDGLEVVLGDVREVSRDRFGTFDLVLCLGILYHLDAPDVFGFLRTLRAVCRRAVLIDTHFGLKPAIAVSDSGRTYWGWRYREHDPASTAAEREQEARASIDNPQSFWPTRPSLYNLVADAGFTSVLEVRVPRAQARTDRLLLVGLAGERRPLESAPQLPALPRVRWPEREPLRAVSQQRGRLHRAFRAVRRAVPAPARRAARRLLARAPWAGREH